MLGQAIRLDVLWIVLEQGQDLHLLVLFVEDRGVGQLDCADQAIRDAGTVLALSKLLVLFLASSFRDRGPLTVLDSRNTLAVGQSQV